MTRLHKSPQSPQSLAALFALASTLVLVGGVAGVAQAAGSPVDASHEVRVEGQQLHVTTRWYPVLSNKEWDFAVPLPPGTRVLNAGPAPVHDPQTGALLGVRFEEPPPRPLTLELELPWLPSDALIPLALPPDPGWQRIEVEGGEGGERLVPGLGPALPMHTAGYYGPGDLAIPERMRIDRRLDRRHPAGAAYVPGALMVEAGGLPAQLESGTARKRGLGLAAGGVFVGGLIVLSVVFRRQGDLVAAEEAEAYLDDEFRNLEHASPAEPS